MTRAAEMPPDDEQATLLEDEAGQEHLETADDIRSELATALGISEQEAEEMVARGDAFFNSTATRLQMFRNWHYERFGLDPMGVAGVNRAPQAADWFLNK